MAYYFYYYQSEGTLLRVDRTWNEATKNDYEGEISSSTKIVWKDYFDVTYGVLDGYEILNITFDNFNITRTTYNNDGTITLHGTMQSEGNITIDFSAKKIDDSGNSGEDSGGSGRGSKGAYIGIHGIARKIKKGYIGIDGVARKIKKAYIGIGGVARPCWGEGKLEYYGTITNLSEGRCKISATHVGNYALFGGGADQYSLLSGAHKSVDVYDSSLTKTIATDLSIGKYKLSATHVGDYALFGGGADHYNNHLSTVDAYDSSLTKTIATDLSAARYELSATHVGNYALFGGGRGTLINYNDPVPTVDAYDAYLTRTMPDQLNASRLLPSTTHIDNYAIFCGGDIDVNSNLLSKKLVVEIYDTTLTKSILDTAASNKHYAAATTVGGYVLNGGGNYSSSTVSVLFISY